VESTNVEANAYCWNNFFPIQNLTAADFRDKVFRKNRRRQNQNL
jgi:hypothetical protein